MAGPCYTFYLSLVDLPNAFSSASDHKEKNISKTQRKTFMCHASYSPTSMFFVWLKSNMQYFQERMISTSCIIHLLQVNQNCIRKVYVCNSGALDRGGGRSRCRMSILRNGYDACLCHYKIPMFPVKFKKWQCCMSL